MSVRRRPSPPPQSYQPQPGVSPIQHHTRFPHPRSEHLDADARREAASKGGFVPSRGGLAHKYYPPGGLNLTSGEWKLLGVVVLVAAAVRLFRLSWPDSVVFDEVHFGKFASKYLKTRYFVDVHPPLAKLLITFAGLVFGYDGDFDFKDIAKPYPSDVPYVAMRMVPALLGVFTVPLAYLTLRALDCRATTALLASVFITFENGMITQSRHILLDSPLIFFTALTIFLWVAFCNEDKHEPFTETWWAFLVLSGLSLGAAVSVKWVGLFTIATVGCSVLYQLWNLLGDLRVSPSTWMRHFIARALCLILIPSIFYMSMFGIHFLILQSSGDGDGFMSSEFQHTLSGRGMQDTFADVALGSVITLRHINTQGGYLHSHAHTYPGGSKQQQITLYPHRDGNNEWRIVNATHELSDEIDWTSASAKSLPIKHLTNGMRVKFLHPSTSKHLHSHDVRPPMSDVDFQNEVSAYGMEGFAGDANDDWIVEIESGDRHLSPGIFGSLVKIATLGLFGGGRSDRESWKRVRTLRTVVRFRHALQGCYLFSHKVKLPDWAYEQQEVTCNKNAVRANSLWFVETNVHPGLSPTAEKINYTPPSFLSKFLELQSVMWTTNKGLTDRHTFDSRPEDWIWLRRGINFWVKDHRHIYLIGNPIIWWLSSLSVVSYIVVRGFMILRAQRGCRDFDNTKVVKYSYLTGFLFLGYTLHYVPFFLLSRQLFLHHYFPALYFSILLLCACFDLLTSTLRPKIRLQVGLVLALLAIWCWSRFSPLAYASPWTKAKCQSAKWVRTWDFSCGDFYDDYSQYSGHVASTPSKSLESKLPVVTVGGEPGGRGAIVVPDAKDLPDPNNKNGNAANKDGDSTTTAGLKVEPGVDIFAEKAKDVQSSSSARPTPENVGLGVGEEKMISSVGAAGESVVSPPQVEKEDTGTNRNAQTTTTSSTSSSASSSSSSSSSSASSSEAALSPSSSSSSSSSSASSSETKKTTVGPVDEMEAEAAKAAAELYPEALD